MARLLPRARSELFKGYVVAVHFGVTVEFHHQVIARFYFYYDCSTTTTNEYGYKIVRNSNIIVIITL